MSTTRFQHVNLLRRSGKLSKQLMKGQHRMKNNESIQDMHTRFTSIINELHSMGEIIPRNKLFRKILSILPGSWESKVNAMITAKDLQELAIDELFSNLKIYEMKKKNKNKKKKKKKKDNKIREPKREKNLRKDVADNVVKQALAAWGDSSSESEEDDDQADISMMAVESEAAVYDSIFSLMAKSDNNENDDDDDEVNFLDVQRNIKSYSPKKLISLANILIDAYHSFINDKDALIVELGEAEQSRDDLVVIVVDLKETIESLKKEKDALTEKIANIEHERNNLVVVVVDLKETIECVKKEKEVLVERVANIEHERDDLLVVVVDLKEIIEELKRESRSGNTQKGKEVASEEYLRLENELKSVKSSLYAKLEKNRQLQEDLGKVKSDLEKSLKWTWSSDAITAMYINSGGNKQEIGFQKEKTPYNPHSKYVNVPDNWLCTYCNNTRHFKETWSNQQWCMDSGCSKHMIGGTNDFISLKALHRGSVSFENDKKEYILGVVRIGKLKYSLLSISQICDKGNKVEFVSKICTVTNLVTGEVVLVAKIYKNIYVADFESLQNGDLSCLSVVDDDAELWHTRLGQASLTLLNKLVKKDLDETFQVFVAFVKKIQVKMSHNVVCIRSSHGPEFDNAKFDEFCAKNGITHNFSAPRKPQQNGVVERKYRTLEDMARTMLIDSGIGKGLWAKVISTACYLVNMCMIRSLLNKTSYELLNGKKTKLTHLRKIGCKCFVLNNGMEVFGKFDAKSDEGIILGYSSQDREQSIVPGEVIDMENGKADMMSHVEELNEDGATISPIDGEEPGPSITTIEVKNIVIDAVQGTPYAEIRRSQESQSEIPGSSNNETQVRLTFAKYVREPGSLDTGNTLPTFEFTMELQEQEAIEYILSINVEGSVIGGGEGVSESEGEENTLVESRELVPIETSAPDSTTEAPTVGPDPSTQREPTPGSSYSPQEEKKDSEEEDYDNVAIASFISARSRKAPFQGSTSKRPIMRLQMKEEFEFVLRKVVNVDDEVEEEPGSLVCKSSKNLTIQKSKRESYVFEKELRRVEGEKYGEKESKKVVEESCETVAEEFAEKISRKSANKGKSATILVKKKA
ncbi:uncharacterized protein [Nicotiana sylvestris]|uniref:uncharacterized protein n=1 Tax=Nicotiana sylvestris TaxID=4096 RepID=UPI00388C6CD1